MEKMSMIKSITIVLFFLLLSYLVIAQNAAFVTEGKIIYERRINTNAVLRALFVDEDSKWVDELVANYLKQHGQFATSEFTLQFTETKSLYTPVKVAKKEMMIDLDNFSGQNIVYNDFVNKTSVSQRSLEGDKFLVSDSIRKFVWKATDEFRDIAGFKCRRANGLMFDSIYVVAFYTDQIVPKVGPESFSGLPGGILGIALPHNNTTWFATKVIVDDVSTETLQPPLGKEAKKFNSFNDYIKTIKTLTSNFGKRGAIILERLLL